MQKTTQTIQRIESPYVREDYVQTIVKYKNAITILSQDGVQLHGTKDNISINQYLVDERRKHFPYANIPMHYTKEKIFSDRICHVNQIFEFNKTYIELCDGNLIERFIVKDNKEAILLKKAMPKFKRTSYLTRKELENRFLKAKEEEQTYYFGMNGFMSIEQDFMKLIPTEERIYEQIQEIFKKNIQYFREYQNAYPGSEVAVYLRKYPLFLDYYEKVIQNMDLSIMDFEIPIGFANSFIIAKIRNNEISLEEVEIYFIHTNYYEVVTYDVPITKYTLEQLKFVSKMNKTKEPRIPLKLNPGVTKLDIQDAKEMVRTLRKK